MIEYEYSEKAGFMVGRTARLADWRFRKEAREFKQLTEKLRKRKWAKEVLAEGGIRLARMRDKQNRYNHRSEVVAKKVREQREQRLARAKKREFVCQNCEAVWSRVVKPGRRLPTGPAPKACGLKCRRQLCAKRKLAAGSSSVEKP